MYTKHKRHLPPFCLGQTPRPPFTGKVTTESTAETDDDSVFPLTPDSKRTGSIQRIIDTSARAASPTSSHHDDLPETIGSKTEDIGDIFLQHLETLGPHIFRLVVHYKEAVRERQRMRLYTTYWEAEENTRRGTLLHLLYQDVQNEFVRSEQQSQTLLNMALEKHSPAAIASDTKFLAAVCDRNKASLHRTDTQLDVIKDHINRSQLFRSSVDGDSVQKSDAAGDCVAICPYHNPSQAGQLPPPTNDDIYHDHFLDNTHDFHAALNDRYIAGASLQPGDGHDGLGYRTDGLVMQQRPPSELGFGRGQPTLPNNESDSEFFSGLENDSHNLLFGSTMYPPHYRSHVMAPASDGAVHHQLQPDSEAGPIYFESTAVAAPSNHPYSASGPPSLHHLPNHLGSFFQGYSQPSLTKNEDALLPPGNQEYPPREVIFSAQDTVTASSNQRGAKKRSTTTFRPYQYPPPKKSRTRGVSGSGSQSQVSELLPSMAAPPQPTTTSVTQPSMSELPYDITNTRHMRIVASARTKILDYAVNELSLPTGMDREQVVKLQLEISATAEYNQEAFGKKWAASNWKTLYLSLSEPCRFIMLTCKKHARAGVQRGFNLRPPPQSTTSEPDHQAAEVEDLLDSATFPPKYVFGKDETGALHFLENHVVWDVLLNTVRELKLYEYVTSLKSLFCTSAAAVKCALRELRTGKLVEIPFSGIEFKSLHDSLEDYIDKEPVDYIICAIFRSFGKRWSSFKVVTQVIYSVTSQSFGTHVDDTHSSRPPSVMTYATPTLASLQRQGSSSRLSGASSPASSQASHHGLVTRSRRNGRRTKVTHKLLAPRYLGQVPVARQPLCRGPVPPFHCAEVCDIRISLGMPVSNCQLKNNTILVKKIGCTNANASGTVQKHHHVPSSLSCITDTHWSSTDATLKKFLGRHLLTLNPFRTERLHLSAAGFCIEGVALRRFGVLMMIGAQDRDRMAELDGDRYLEREREWNKRHPPPRPSSSLSSHSNHSHTYPSRPPSVTAYATPTLASLQRRGSSSRLSGASSPASSQASHDSLRDPEEVEEERKVTHKRERNWNSPQPKWNTTRHHSYDGSGNEVTSASDHLSQSKSGRSLRASSSLPRLTPEAQSKGSLTAVKLPPLDLESSPKRGGRSNKEPDSSPHHTPTISSPSPTPGSLASNRASGVNRSSLIPVPSPSKKNGLFNSGSFASSTPKANDEEKFKKGHRKRLTKFTESGSIHPRTSIHGALGMRIWF
ncbi:hypothetical protein C8R48DRAFT_675800 [Suillus tomentosus]|nr:hypothetical protein C8R48DRAFT_675800 [Suillus tomentosus]